LHVGTAPTDFVDWTTTKVYFHGFAELSTTRDEFVRSPKFPCFGHQWRLKLYPGGEEDSPEGYIAVGLCNKSYTSINVQWGCMVRDANYKEVIHNRLQIDEFTEVGAGSNAWTITDFAKRSRLLDKLVDGSLVIEVRMRPSSTDKSITQFIPTNPINKNVLQKFMDEETADVVFEVNNESCQNEEEHINKKTKTTTRLYAHRFVLQDISTMLAELCKPAEGGDITTVSITDAKPKIFEYMLYYAYGGKLSDKKLKANAKDIINACDKYGLVNLKLEAEAMYVRTTEFTMDNMMDNLLYADSKNLALLKEAVMDYIVANKRDILGRVSFDNVPGGAISDVLAAVSRHWGEDTEDDGEKESIKYNTMRVGTLRKMLDEKGLDVDGSRESMIALLKEHDSDDNNDDDNGEDNNDVEPVDA